MAILTTFYCKPGSSLFEELHSWLWKSGGKVPNLRRLSTTYIKIFSAMEVKGQIDTEVFQAPISSVAWSKAVERVSWVAYWRKDTKAQRKVLHLHFRAPWGLHQDSDIPHVHGLSLFESLTDSSSFPDNKHTLAGKKGALAKVRTRNLFC